MKKIIPTLALSLFVLFAIGQVSKTGYYYYLEMLKDGNFSTFYGFFDVNQMKDSNVCVKYKSINELLTYGSSVNYYSIPEEESLYSCCELHSYSKGMEMYLMGTLDTN